jgi:hypothetical protein
MTTASEWPDEVVKNFRKFRLDGTVRRGMAVVVASPFNAGMPRLSAISGRPGWRKGLR